MKHEYEIIAHNNVNFHVFIVNLLYRTPHIHKDYELCLVLDGSATLFTGGESYHLRKNDIFILNPFSGHEIKAEDPALILSLQVSPSLFSDYYPRILNTQFDITVLNKTYDFLFRTICRYMLDIAFSFFHKEEFYEFKCVILLNQLFQYLLKHLPNHMVAESERRSQKKKGKRIESIVEYIDRHYSEKLLLRDIAEYLKVDIYYLSHFFKENFGITFQNYLLKIRCEHAKRLLLSSDLSLLDICIASGFSAPKYFNKGFEQQYGLPPKEFRKQFRNKEFEIQKSYILSQQEFLSEASSMLALEKFNIE